MLDLSGVANIPHGVRSKFSISYFPVHSKAQRIVAFLKKRFYQ